MGHHIHVLFQRLFRIYCAPSTSRLKQIFSAFNNITAIELLNILLISQHAFTLWMKKIFFLSKQKILHIVYTLEDLNLLVCTTQIYRKNPSRNLTRPQVHLCLCKYTSVKLILLNSFNAFQMYAYT